MLLVSLVVLVPAHTHQSLGLSIGFVAAIGLTYAAVILVRVIRHDMADMADKLGYGACPVAAYTATLAAAVWLLASDSADRPQCAGRRAVAAACGQHPQRLGHDDVAGASGDRAASATAGHVTP